MLFRRNFSTTETLNKVLKKANFAKIFDKKVFNDVKLLNVELTSTRRLLKFKKNVRFSKFDNIETKLIDNVTKNNVIINLL